MVKKAIDVFAGAFARESLKRPENLKNPENVENDLEERVDFYEMEEEEQVDLMYQIHDLVARIRDEGKQLREDSRIKQTTKHKMIKVGVRWVAKPVLLENTPDQALIQAGKKRIEQLRERLYEIGETPNIIEAYKRKIVRAYYESKMLASIENSEERLEQIKHIKEDIRAQSLKSFSGSVVGSQTTKLESLAAEELAISERIDGANSSEVGRNLLRIYELKGYSDAIQRHRMVEIPSVKQTVEQALEYMRGNQPFMLSGHLGSGKTEVARYAAKMYMLETGNFTEEQLLDPEALFDSLEPEIFSGGDESSVYDLIGKLKLVGRGSEDGAELANRVKALALAFKEHNFGEVPEAELAKIIIGKGDATETVFNYGPFGRALKRGVPIIIDEINIIPPEVISRINDIILQPVGTKIFLQENSNEPLIKTKGFAVLSTLNLGSQYAGIKEVNAAFKSRWISKEMDYPTVSESYDLILTTLLRKDRVRLPANFKEEYFEKMVDLSIVTSEIQGLFCGRTEGQSYMSTAHNATAERVQLKKAVVSTRDLLRKIVEPWKNSNFSESLDDIIAQRIIASETHSMDDQKILAEMFLRRGFFSDWTIEDFKKRSILSISQRELDALQSMMQTNEYIANDKDIIALKARLQVDSSALNRDLMIGLKE